MNLLTTKQAAMLLNVHPKHVYRLMKQGLPAARVGAEWRFERDTILRWARSARRSSSSGSASPAEVTPPLIAANGDVVIDELLGWLQRRAQTLLGFVLADHSTGSALLGAGRVLFAGSHEDWPQPSAVRFKSARLHLATREIGLAYRSRKAIGTLADLGARRLASRPATAGVRRLLDTALERAGIAPQDVFLRARDYASHREVVMAVAAGQADVGLTTQAWATALGLAFQPLGSEAYGLSVRADLLGDPRVVRVCELTQTAEFRQRLREQYGYGTDRTGELRIG